ncbi:Quinol monooxygenase YgiN [Pseudonocardia ammonioxydans]|uniref:Quinol monooxygenase YgiN n=1 Tax=Pseudonocardia ammonioxydans TaxID=260086 RepID=A0A1I5EPH0_PSUAM|nr:putative quinol monooxygenase [Pseudonocardia ammonioxydans]SFO13253.1 Quinol monooxygenase YgiN [Pseudonocardia ammonioxydans]
MILIVLKAQIRPDKRDKWLSGISEYKKNVNSEPGNISFDYHENFEKENEFVIVEVFRDGKAGEEHVKTDHAQNFFPFMSTVVSEKPKINYQDIDGDAWNEMAEVTPQ